jgi:hypothetical protein
MESDLEAARRVELDLPQTGVCSANRVLPELAGDATSCCTPETPQGACCPPKPELAEHAPCCSSAARREVAQVEPAE